MQKLFIAVALLFCVFDIHAQKNVVASNPVVITGHLTRITKPLRDFKAADELPFVKVRDLEGIVGKDEEFEEGSNTNFGSDIAKDAALQQVYKNAPI